MRGTWLLVASVVAVQATTSAAQQGKGAPSDARLVAAIEEFVPQAMRWDGTPGLTIAVGRHGKLIWERGYGWADLGKEIPMTPATITRAGSMSKPYTGTAAMQLVERGVLGLEQPVNRYLGNIRVVNPLGPRDITVRDVMTHTSGLSEADVRYADLAPVQTIHDYLASVFARAEDRGSDGQYLRWIGKVGERASYSNIGITLLGLLIERTNPEHLSYSDYVRKNILQPLGMRATFFPPDHDEPEPPNGLSMGYAAIGGMLLPVPRLWTPVHPAATLYATAAEHLRLVQTFLDGGNYGGQKILSQSSVAQMLSPTVPFDDLQLGLVWMLANQGKPNTSFGHSGAYMFGWTNMGAGFPRYDLGVVVTANRWPMPRAQSQADTLIVEFIGNWLALEEANPTVERPARSWAWKRSYTIGMIVAHSYHGRLQARTRLTPRQLQAMSASGAPRSGNSATAQWDPDGFRAGFEDLAPIATDSVVVKSFFKSPSLKVHPAELELLFADIGERGGLPRP